MYEGLSSAQASDLLKKIGPNKLPEAKKSLIKKLIHNFVSPVSLMLIVASVLSFSIGKIFDGNFILFLLIINIVITLWQESKADNAIKKLNDSLNQSVKTFRDKSWKSIDSVELVPGDIVRLTGGEVIPADGRLVSAEHLSVNESALTGESLPVDKNLSDLVYSGSYIAQGIAIVEIVKTGKDTKFGHTFFSVERVRKQSLLEKDILTISRFLIVLSLIAVVILSTVFVIKKEPTFEILTLGLSLIIAGIPISLSTIMTLIIEFGVIALAKKEVIVRRLSALEDLANIDLLLTDKTGTLTKNKISVQDVYSYGEYKHNDVLRYASIIASSNSDSLIDQSILEKLKLLNLHIPNFKKKDFVPADSKRKRSTVHVEIDEKTEVISMGAPQIISGLCKLDDATKKKFDEEVNSLAKRGHRTLAVAMASGAEEKGMSLIGILALSDSPRPDARTIIKFMGENGIKTIMVTGDNRAIATHISSELELNEGELITKDQLKNEDLDKIGKDFFQNTYAFAEILPEDKFQLVQSAKRFFTVASTGDGINDLPAVKAANVGIAVKNSVSALKAAADIVLISEGIGVIRDAIIESRKIFERIYTYSLYRISESLRLIITIVVLGIAYNEYPLTALQIILLALLNDIPIISLAFDRVSIAKSPSKIDSKKRFMLSGLYGLVGVATSILLFLLVFNIWKIDWSVLSTMFFLKLTISGHLLIFVAHTKNRWWKFLPSKTVMISIFITQIIATIFALTGFLMPARIEVWQVLFVWLWALSFMQVSELIKYLFYKLKK